MFLLHAMPVLCGSASRTMFHLHAGSVAQSSGTARDFQPQFPPICGWNLSHCSLSSKIRRLLPYPTGRTPKTKRKICLKYIFKTEKQRKKENNSSLNQPRLYAKEWESHNIQVGRMFTNMRTKHMRPQWSMIASHPLRHTPDHMLAHEPGACPYKFFISGLWRPAPNNCRATLCYLRREEPKGCFLFGEFPFVGALFSVRIHSETLTRGESSFEVFSGYRF